MTDINSFSQIGTQGYTSSINFAKSVEDLKELEHHPLALAAGSGKLGTMKWLKNRRDDLDQLCLVKNFYAPNIHGVMTPLHLAVLGKEYGSVAWLLDHEVDINAQASSGDTAMHFAAQMGDLVMIKLLALSGANLNLVNTTGQTPVSYVLHTSYLDILQKIYFQRVSLEGAFPHSHKVCHLAVQYGHIDVIRKLIEKGYQIDMTNDQEETPLHIAVQKGDLQIIDLLIKAGAKVDGKDVDGQTPLHHAVQYNNLDVVRFLCQNGADLRAEDFNKANLVHIAAQYGALDILKWVYQEQNLDMNCLDGDEDLPAHYAARNGEVKIIDYLHNLKLDINATNVYDETPLNVALVEKHINVLEYFHEKADLDINSSIQDGNYLIHIAVYEEYIPLIKWLIQKGADINVQNSDDDTPLHLAIVCKNLEMMSLLKDNGADVNIKNEYDETALMCALNNEVDASLFCTPEAELDLSNTNVYDYLIKNSTNILSCKKLQEKIFIGINILKSFEALEYSYDVECFTKNLTKKLVQIIEDAIANILKGHAKNNTSNMLEYKTQMQELNDTLTKALNSEVGSIALKDALYEGMLTINGVFFLEKLAKATGGTYDCYSELGYTANSMPSSRDSLKDLKENKPYKVQKLWNKDTDIMNTFEESDSSSTIAKMYSDINFYLTVDSMGKFDDES